MSEHIAIDPGNEESALIYFTPDPELPGGMGNIRYKFVPNEEVRQCLKVEDYTQLLLEMPKARGMPTSNEEMETIFWIGRFFEIARRRNIPRSLVFRGDVKVAICGSAQATDSNIRAALLDHFGGEQNAIGGVKCRDCKGSTQVDGGRTTCPTCDGGGQVPGAKGLKKCTTCKGRQTIRVGKVACGRCPATPGWDRPPGPLTGISSHGFAALAVAVAWRQKPTTTHRILPPGGNATMAAKRKEKRENKLAKAAAKAEPIICAETIRNKARGR